ncbi:MAG: hypothetical protein HYX28_10075 [Candidatus Koribacter versatilis]|uniref:Uncharacterized protein n=1 Tax=Candidatus Korobacter versatilis TaxID=658062 RepID=A0A932A9M2_9BACT|nr:hypothetical protein [Candidatus Koribacter versatilis]
MRIVITVELLFGVVGACASSRGYPAEQHHNAEQEQQSVHGSSFSCELYAMANDVGSKSLPLFQI